MDELIAKLEAATGPDRGLDYAIWNPGGQPLTANSLNQSPLYTASIDAALMLVPELTDNTRPLKIVLGVSESGNRFGCVIENWQWGTIGSSSRPNWPIAICIAAIKARRGPRE